MVRLDAPIETDWELQDLIRCFLCHLLNLHPPFRGCDQDWHGMFPIDNRSKIKLFSNINRFGDQNLMGNDPLRSCLIVNHLHSDEFLCRIDDLIFAFGKLHPTCFTPAAGMHLNFHDRFSQS